MASRKKENRMSKPLSLLLPLGLALLPDSGPILFDDNQMQRGNIRFSTINHQMHSEMTQSSVVLAGKVLAGKKLSASLKKVDGSDAIHACVRKKKTFVNLRVGVPFEKLEKGGKSGKDTNSDSFVESFAKQREFIFDAMLGLVCRDAPKYTEKWFHHAETCATGMGAVVKPDAVFKAIDVLLGDEGRFVAEAAGDEVFAWRAGLLDLRQGAESYPTKNKSSVTPLNSIFEVQEVKKDQRSGPLTSLTFAKEETCKSFLSKSGKAKFNTGCVYAPNIGDLSGSGRVDLVLSEGDRIVELFKQVQENTAPPSKPEYSVASLFSSTYFKEEHARSEALRVLNEKQSYPDTAPRVNYDGEIRMGAPYGGTSPADIHPSKAAAKWGELEHHLYRFATNFFHEAGHALAGCNHLAQPSDALKVKLSNGDEHNFGKKTFQPVARRDFYVPLWDNSEERRNTGALVMPQASALKQLQTNCPLREESNWVKWSFVGGEEEIDDFRRAAKGNAKNGGNLAAGNYPFYEIAENVLHREVGMSQTFGHLFHDFEDYPGLASNRSTTQTAQAVSTRTATRATKNKKPQKENESSVKEKKKDDAKLLTQKGTPAMHNLVHMIEQAFRVWLAEKKKKKSAEDSGTQPKSQVDSAISAYWTTVAAAVNRASSFPGTEKFNLGERWTSKKRGKTVEWTAEEKSQWQEKFAVAWDKIREGQMPKVAVANSGNIFGKSENSSSSKVTKVAVGPVGNGKVFPPAVADAVRVFVAVFGVQLKEECNTCDAKYMWAKSPKPEGGKVPKGSLVQNSSNTVPQKERSPWVGRSVAEVLKSPVTGPKWKKRKDRADEEDVVCKMMEGVCAALRSD